MFVVSFGAFCVPIVMSALALRSDTLERAMPSVLVGSSLLAVAGVARTAEMVRQSRNTAEASQALSAQLTAALFEREQLHEELLHTALYDPLTGLANRRLFQERLDQALALEDHTCAVMFIDLDDFKNINDSLGHAVGDLALVALARRIEEHLRTDDVVARLGGDEFAVLVPDPSDAGAAHSGRAAAGRRPSSPSSPAVRRSTSASASASRTPATPRTRTTCSATPTSRCTTPRSPASPGWRSSRTRCAAAGWTRLDLRAELRAAIDHDELHVVYQPVVDLNSGRVDGIEALVRWTRRDGTVVPTPEFIALAEETGLIRPLGRYVLRQATAQARAWRDLGINLNIAVNVSGQQLADPGFVEAVTRAVAALGQDRVLVLELTESSLIGSVDDVEVLHELRRRGCRIAIDDFGTGSPRWPTSPGCPSTSSSSPHPSSTASTTAATTSRWPRRCSRSARASATSSSPRASSGPRSPTRCAGSAASSGRATSSRGPPPPRISSPTWSAGTGASPLPRPGSTSLRRAEPIPGSTYACCRVSPAWAGSSVGTSVRLKSGRSAVRPRPCPQATPQVRPRLACGFARLAAPLRHAPVSDRAGRGRRPPRRTPACSRPACGARTC